MFEKQPWMQRAGEFPQSDQEYFALLARAVFSAGLGPKVVESRWQQMGEAFHGFDAVRRFGGSSGRINQRKCVFWRPGGWAN